jgi:alpha-N-arabinofuranosidase
MAFLVHTAAATDELSFRVLDRTVHKVDHRLFGQFLERASFGEPGPEAVADQQTGRLPTNVVALLKAMRIPVIRFPGGTDVDYINWTDMIDRVPGRKGARPLTTVGSNAITNRFGYDEYFALRDELGCETIIVLNLLDALSGKRPLREAALHVAGLVAYCNAPVGAKLPEGMPDWPAVRTENGHPAAFRVEYFQLGNEWQHFRGKVIEGSGIAGKKSLAAWYVEVLHAIIRAIRAVDPGVKLIIDGRMGDDMEKVVLRDPAIRDAVRYVTFHTYAPGFVGPVRNEKTTVDPATLGLDDWWYACASMPGEMKDGVNVGLGAQTAFAHEQGYRIACTEWNWNGWGFKEAKEPFASRLLPVAQGLGTAGFLHGLIRQGDAIDLATQSMLVGHRWGITAVRVDPSGANQPYYLPQGLATMFYGLHHGDRLLAVEHGPLPSRPQPYVVGKWTKWPEAVPVIADVDLLVTADDRRVYVHAIHRHIDRARDIAVDLSGVGLRDGRAVHYRYVERSVEDREEAGTPQACHIVSEEAEVKGGILRVNLRSRSISIVEVER